MSTPLRCRQWHCPRLSKGTETRRDGVSLLSMGLSPMAHNMAQQLSGKTKDFNSFATGSNPVWASTLWGQCNGNTWHFDCHVIGSSPVPRAIVGVFCCLFLFQLRQNIEDCVSGLNSLFAKQMTVKAVHRFESCIFCQKPQKLTTD